MTVVSDRIARAFSWYRIILVVGLDRYKVFERIWHAALLPKLKSYGVLGWLFWIILSFLSIRWRKLVLERKHL